MPARGRPRAFDSEAALDAALAVFWRHGYEGASLTMLTEAMGINRPSLYAAFGSKEELFRQAIQRYEATTGAMVDRALTAPSARQTVEWLLTAAVAAITSPRHPRGCMLVASALTAAPNDRELVGHVNRRRAAAHRALAARFRRAMREGELPAGADAPALALYVTTILRGLSVEAIGGASRARLSAVVRLALRAWPPPLP